MEISIKEACHENWADMSPNEQGAFCNKCVKTVIDFTDKSLDEIKSFFAGRGQESTCGRFEEKQLNALSFDAFFERFRNFEFTKRFAVILFFTFGLCLFDASTAVAQSDSLVVKSDTTVNHLEALQPKPLKPMKWTTLTYTPVLPPQIEQLVTTVLGGVSAIPSPQKFDWSAVPPAQPVWFKVSEEKVPVRPAPLKRERVYRRRD